jgi:pimeloyl-ACP methyl ester carboxylesterase
MPQVDLRAGTIEYEDSGGDGPVLVLLHGLLMNGSLWRNVVPELTPDNRCIVPTLPLGGHRRPMHPDADLSLAGQVALLADFLEALDLDDVIMVQNDWGGAVVLAGEPAGSRIGRLVLASCEAFDNYPPGLPGRVASLAAKVPGGINAALQPMRVKRLRRLPFTFGWMAKRPIPDPVIDDWLAPALSDPAIRRDLAKYARGATGVKDEFCAATERLRSFDRPALVIWAAEDRVMPIEHGRRLAELLPQGRLVEIADSYTLIPEDQPQALAGHLRGFAAREAEYRSA